MSGDDDFKPKLGKIRSLGGKRGRRYLHRVLQAVVLAGGRHRRKRAGFQGNRIGRGAGVGRVLASRDGYAAFRQRNVIIKSRFVRVKGLKPSQVHLRYIQRDGVTRDGTPGQLYSASQDRADSGAFVERSAEDRHQFRFIVSIEDGAEYEDLKPVIRDLMKRMEADLGTGLDWVAVDHFNTGHPHTHIVLRGKDDRGKDLVIAREYMKHGMRERAREIVSLDLGPRTDLEIVRSRRAEMDQERFTNLDRRLQTLAREDGLVRVATERQSTLDQTLVAGRLQKLGRLGLAEEVAPGTWRLSEDLQITLRDMALKGDIIKTMNRELTERGRKLVAPDYIIYDPSDHKTQPITGRILARGLSDEINDRHYLIVEATDGYAHYVDIGAAEATDPSPEGSVVTIRPRMASARMVDKTVADIAAVHHGRYSRELHHAYDPTARAEYIEAHIRRLEAMRRETRGAQREPDGTWIIARDHLERAKAYDQRLGRANPVTVEVLSKQTIERQVRAVGVTWLDTELASETPTPLRETGFGSEAKEAIRQRRQWLMSQDLEISDHATPAQRTAFLATLRRRELTRVGTQLAEELGLTYRETPKAGRIDGIYRKAVDLPGGKFAVIETRGKDFMLVPWRPVMERGLGREISGVVRGDRISWSWGRERSGPEL
ncbi:MAG: relaxase/mobilization nuclease and DUF3363 domain-containing protein [Rhodospirillaceae bacterium]|nr:relaxase/mobilization nuclease and DUF3363 domain-containing protein [Rhodospirillaceae bacterium]